ncbi:MAG: CopD family protein [Acidiferrobacter sp.]
MGEWPLFILLTVHLLAAITWVGGLLFFMLAVIPAARRYPALRLASILGRSFRPIAWSALGVLLASGVGLLIVGGLTRAVCSGGAFWHTAFGVTLAVKLILVLVVVILAAWHDVHLGPRAERQGSTGAVRWVGRIVGLLSLVIAVAGVALATGR